MKPDIKQLVVISGKGGTGKTSVTASLAALHNNAVLADCDVDAADLHMLVDPTVRIKEDFSGGSQAKIKSGYCTACGKCEELCRFDAIYFDGPGNGNVAKTFRVDPLACEGCGVCAWFCAENAITFEPVVNGQIFTSQTKYGTMVHARLGPGEENSGKMVTQVRTKASETAEKEKKPLVIIDGSPGIGCPVIASVADTDLILAIAEPTRSGVHDLGRILDLAAHFGIKIAVAVNKCTVNEEETERIEKMVSGRGGTNVGRIRYDRSVTDSMVRNRPAVEDSTSLFSQDVKNVWERTYALLFQSE